MHDMRNLVQEKQDQLTSVETHMAALESSIVHAGTVIVYWMGIGQPRLPPLPWPATGRWRAITGSDYLCLRPAVYLPKTISPCPLPKVIPGRHLRPVVGTRIPGKLSTATH